MSGSGGDFNVGDVAAANGVGPAGYGGSGCADGKLGLITGAGARSVAIGVEGIPRKCDIGAHFRGIGGVDGIGVCGVVKAACTARPCSCSVGGGIELNALQSASSVGPAGDGNG